MFDTILMKTMRISIRLLIREFYSFYLKTYFGQFFVKS